MSFTATVPPPSTPEEYRRLAGLSLKEAARQAGVCRDYLRQAELHGCTAPLANRLAALYHCPVELFGIGSSPAFYLYIKQGKPWMIDRESCGFCNEGAGLKSGRSKRGRWAEAYSSIKATEAAWAEFGGSEPR